MATSRTMPYNYGQGAGETEDDTLGPDRPNANAPAGGAPAPYAPNDPQQAQNRTGPQPTDRASTQPIAPPRTFAQMQAEGEARPPMPTPGTQLGTQLGMGDMGAMASPPPPPNANQITNPTAMTPDASAASAGAAGGALYYRDPSTNAVSAVSPEDYARLTQQSQLAGTGTTFKGTDASSGQVYNPTFDRWYDPSNIPPGMTPEQFFGQQYNPGAGSPVAWSGSVNDQLTGKSALGATPPPNPYGMDFSVGADGNVSGIATPQGNTPTGQRGVSLPPSGFTPSASGFDTGVPNTNPVALGSVLPATGTGTPGKPGNLPSTIGSINGTPGNPATTDLLGMLTGGATGTGAGSAVQNATQQKTLDLLNSPSPYGQQQVKDAYGWLGGQIDDQYALKQNALDEEMARRGLGVSTNKAGRLNDLNIGKRDAKTSLGYDLAQNYAKTLGDYQTNAINAGNTVGTSAQNNQQGWIQQLMGYGQNAFNNDLATNAQNQNAQNSFQDFLLKMLGMGYGGAT